MAVKRGRPMSFQAHMEELACEQLAMCRERVVVSLDEYKRAKAFRGGRSGGRAQEGPVNRTCPTCHQAWAFMDARKAMRSRGPVPGTGGRSTGRRPRARYQPLQEQAATPAASSVAKAMAPALEARATSPRREKSID